MLYLTHITARRTQHLPALLKQQCVVCWAAEAIVLYWPCGHKCTCQGCSGAFVACAVLCLTCITPVSNAILLAGASETLTGAERL